MIDFQAAERKRLQEPASDIGLESLCALVCLPLSVTQAAVFLLRVKKFNLLPYIDQQQFALL